MIETIVLVGIILAGFSFTGFLGDTSKIFINDQEQTGLQREVIEYRVPVDTTYISPLYNMMFEKLDSGSQNINSDKGVAIDYKEITADNWTKFCKLTKENEEFNKYAGDLLYSQYENEVKYLQNLQKDTKEDDIKVLLCIAKYAPIFKKLGIKEQDKFKFDVEDNLSENEKPTTRVEKTDWFFSSYMPLKNLKYETELETYIKTANFSYNNLQIKGENSFQNIIKRTVNGSIYFWDWKRSKKFDEYKGKQPLRLSNGGQHCYVQAGVQILIASTVNDDLNKLGNWGKFVKLLSNMQEQNRNKTIEFLQVLKTFCSSHEFDTNENSRINAYNQLELLQKKGSPKLTIDILLKIFPKLKRENFDTQKVIFEQPIDPILSAGLSVSGKLYLPASIAIRHLIPNLKNTNAGIGADPPKATNVPNRYGEYVIKYSADNNLLIYKLKGISLDENLASYKETPIDKTFDKKERYTVEPCLHARAVVKLDNSDYYHYCDSNGVYFPEKGLNNIFYNNHSVLDYFKKYNYTKPANHASLLMYEIVN